MSLPGGDFGPIGVGFSNGKLIFFEGGNPDDVIADIGVTGGAVSFHNIRITNVLDPIESGDIVTLHYLDNVISNIDVTKEDIGLGNVENIKNNLLANRDPTNNDDILSEYSVGSRWIRPDLKKEWVCMDNTASASMWQIITADSSNTNIVIEQQKGAPNGIAELDINAQLFPDQLPIIPEEKLSIGTYRGGWNADVNSPIIVDGVGRKGDWYTVIVNGDTNIDGSEDWEIRDTIIFSGVRWEKIAHSTAEKKIDDHIDDSYGVHGVAGLVVGTIDPQILINKTIDATKNVIVFLSDFNIAPGASIDATKIGLGNVNTTQFSYLSGSTSNIQAQINTHTSNTSNPHNVTKTQLGLEHVLNVKHRQANFNPSQLNDILDGYEVGSRWYNEAAGREYVCLDNTEENAIWKETTIIGEVNNAINIGTGVGIVKDKFGMDIRLKSLIADKNISIIEGLNEISLQSKNSHSFTLSPVPVEAYSDNYTTMFTLPWYHDIFYDHDNGLLICALSIVDYMMDIQIVNATTETVLGTLLNIDESGFYEISVASPSENALVEVRIRRSGTGSIDPVMHGGLLRFES